MSPRFDRFTNTSLMDQPRFHSHDVGARLAASARVTSSRLSPDIHGWLDQQRNQPVQVVRVPFPELDSWDFDPVTGNLAHRSNRFFTVEGMHVHTNYGHVPEWWQPIIVQRDIAILGILAKEIDGVLHFLMQAKMEPGNVNIVQLSPTVQATSSNYTKVHHGSRAPYVEYFVESRRGRVLVDVLQSEQGAWFHQKRNRNVVIEAVDDVPDHENFCWLTLGQIRRLLRQPNVINMDARSVLANLPITAAVDGSHDTFDDAFADATAFADTNAFDDALRRSMDPAGRSALHTMTEILSWITGRKSEYTLSARLAPLNSVVGWHRGVNEITHQAGKHFSIVAVRVQASTREVSSWSQPLLTPSGPGLAGFLVKRIDGVLHALVHADVRPGYRDTVELGPTVQCIVNDYSDVPAAHRPEFLDFMLAARHGVRYDVMQSEEGGRFLNAQTRYFVVEADDDFPLRVPPDFAWMTIGQLSALQHFSYYLNIECRSLLLCLKSLS